MLSDYRKLHHILSGIGAVALLLAFVYLALRFGPTIVTFGQDYFSLEELEKVFSKPSLSDFAALLLLTSLTATISFLSSSLLAICNGILFGPWLAFLMNLVANCLGNYLMIQVMQRVDSHHKPRPNPYLERIKQIKNQSIALILAYALPIFPTILVNYWISTQKLSWKKWLVIVSLGTAPTSLLYAVGGKAILDGNRHLLLGLGIVFLTVLVAYFIWHYTHKEKSK